MKFTLKQRKPEVAGVESFIFEPEQKVSWKAGQFFHYVLHHRPTDDRGSDRWFTISAAPSEGLPMITTRYADEKSSTFKKALFAMKPGDVIEMGDLDGDFTLDDLSKEYVFVAGGIGITPFRSILKELDARGEKPSISLIYGNRAADNITFKDEFENFAKSNPNLRIHYVIAPEKLDMAKIQQLVPDMQKPIFYVSGPEPMVENLGTAMKAAGIPADHLKQDWFPGYPEE